MSRFISALAGVGFALFAPAALAQDASEPPPVPENIDVSALMAPGPLPEKTLGEIGAPVTVVEYASLTCSHCGNFYQTTFEPFREKYIDTGKVRFVFRDFPLDQNALTTAALARCLPDDKYFEVVDTLFMNQAEWAFVEHSGPPLFKLLEPFGMNEESAKACVEDKSLIEGIISRANDAYHTFGVRGTPTFFINGKRFGGGMSLADLDAAIEPLLPAAH